MERHQQAALGSHQASAHQWHQLQGGQGEKNDSDLVKLRKQAKAGKEFLVAALFRAEALAAAAHRGRCRERGMRPRRGGTRGDGARLNGPPLGRAG